MKNKEMKVSTLLEEKSRLESEISQTVKVISVLNGGDEIFGESGTVGVYSGHEYRFKVEREVMLKAAEEMLEIKRKALEPVSKKLEAIELMLSD